MLLETAPIMQPSPQSSPLYGQEGEFTVVEMSENMKYFQYPRQQSPDLDGNCVYTGYLDEISNNKANSSYPSMYYNNASIINTSDALTPASDLHTMPLTPPSINVETAENSSHSSSLITSSNAIAEALGGLNEDFNLMEETWPTSLDSLLSDIPSTTPLPELLVANQKEQSIILEPSSRDMIVSSNVQSEQMDPQCNNSFEVNGVTLPASDELVINSTTPMSVSPGGSSIPSPLASLRSSFNSGRRYKRPHSASPLNQDSLDVNTIIRLSPNCLMATPPNTINNFNDGFSGSYGHYLPRPETNNNNVQRSNLNFTPLNSNSHNHILQSQSTSVSLTSTTPTEQTFFKVDLSEQKPVFSNYSTPFNNIQSHSFSTTHTLTKPSLTSTLPPFSFSQSTITSTQTVFSPTSTSPLNSIQSFYTTAESPSVDSSSTDDYHDEDGNEEVPRVCRWVDCNAVFQDRASLSRHIERAHVDQRKGDDYTCFWSACQRKYRAFNARYKLLIHMRVHSGEKPNKCTVSH